MRENVRKKFIFVGTKAEGAAGFRFTKPGRKAGREERRPVFVCLCCE